MLLGTTNSNLPKVSEVKALDVYFALCSVYVFGAILEFASTCYLTTKVVNIWKPFVTSNSGIFISNSRVVVQIFIAVLLRRRAQIRQTINSAYF